MVNYEQHPKKLHTLTTIFLPKASNKAAVQNISK